MQTLAGDTLCRLRGVRQARARAALLRDHRPRACAPRADHPRVRDERRATLDSTRGAVPPARRDAARVQDGEVHPLYQVDRRLQGIGPRRGRIQGGHAVLRTGGRDMTATAEQLRAIDAYWRAANYL